MGYRIAAISLIFACAAWAQDARVPHAPPIDGQTRELSIQELGNFDYDAERGSAIPDDVRRLAGSAVRVRGFMIPMEQAADITRFALVPDLFACCFGQPPGVNHVIVVSTPAGKAVSYYPDEIHVEGRLQVEEKREDGFVVSIFDLEATSIRPVPR